MTHYKIVIEHDPDPDFSWLEQDQSNPNSPTYDPIYPTEADMKAKRNAYDGDWYRNPDNHVALMLTVFKMDDDSDDWEVVDSVGGIDFLVDSDDWQTGTFYTLDALKQSPYLQDVAKDCGFKPRASQDPSIDPRD